MRPLPGTDLSVFPLCLGGNVFGSSADEATSHAILDAYAAAGGNFVDTADSYTNWVEGNPPGLSETYIGSWMASRGNRERMVVTTKLGYGDGLAPDTVRAAAERSFARLGVDVIDLLYAHKDDPTTPLVDTWRVFDGLVRDGRVRHLAVSNYSAARLAELLAVCEREDFARPIVLQQHYNLIDRDLFEGELAALCVREGIATAPYFGLANGFLTGKYRGGAVPADARRAERARQHAHPRGERTVEAVVTIADANGVTPGAVALAWLLAQPTVLAPLASARTPAQLEELLAMASLELSSDELRALDEASRAD